VTLLLSTPCEHGEIATCSYSIPCDTVHYYVKTCGTECNRCPGGSLTPLEPDYRAAAIEWIGDQPPDCYPGEWEQMIQTVIEQTIQPIIAAALHLDQGDV
jgi:hypothetical protein